MHLIVFLIIFPLAMAILSLLAKNETLRKAVVVLGGLGVAVGAVSLAFFNFHQEIVFFPVNIPALDTTVFCVDVVLSLFIIWQALKFKRVWAILLAGAQLIAGIVLEKTVGHQLHVEHALFVDKLSIILSLMIGVIGGLICIYAIGYMREFHTEFHKELKDTRREFFFTIFVFLSAMFGIVFSNNLLWFYCFWEVTTVCSFILIGYKQNAESRANAFRALEFNLLGGLLLQAAIMYLAFRFQIIELDKMLTLGKAAVLFPVVLVSIAGLIKSAQFPFSSWLLGAMVAPTPVSALLHSSTMVKAGVYILVRFAPVLYGTFAGFVVALIGGLTFLIASCIAVSQEDAKKILAYSTVANLGLVVLCAGVGTYEALWAAVLLIIFHAIAKGLLFLCVGVIEHRIHSRSVERMAGLILSMPKLSIMVQLGMAGMFLAPFGMLISKWGVLKALVDYNPLLAVFVVFGSAATLFFWTKWMGKLVTVIEEKDSLEEKVVPTEWIALYGLSALTVGVCVFFPLISSFFIEPYILEIYHQTFVMSRGNIVIMLMMMGMLALFPLSFINYGKKVKVMDPYLGGANAETYTQFRSSTGAVLNMEMKNYYLERYFGEKKLFGYGVALGLALLIPLIAGALL